MTRQRAVVIGQGYVGLPLAVRAAEVGFEVVGFDVDAAKIRRLASGSSYVEDITDDRLAHALENGYHPSDEPRDLAGFDVAVLSVPTPLRDHLPDLSYIESAARAIAPHVTAGCTVILESTTYPGTTEEVVAPLLEAGSGLRAGTDFHLGYSPERIDPGNAEWTLESTPKVVSGVDEPSLAAVQGFYDQIVVKTVPVSGTREAELTKLLENTFRHVNIALVNELAMFAHDLGIDIWEAIDAASTKPFGYMRFTPGPGVGGHCLPIDPSYLSWSVKRTLGHTFRFIELANDVNAHMPDYVVQRVTAGLNGIGRPVNGTKVLVVGVAYKRDTADCRESPGLRIAELLRANGAVVSISDSHIIEGSLPEGLENHSLTEALVNANDVLVVVTDHSNVDHGVLDNAPGLVLNASGRHIAGAERL